MFEMFKVPVPTLVRFTVWLGLEVPAVRLAKVTVDALRLAVGEAPVTLTSAQLVLAKAVPTDVVPWIDT
jgi:hypothetical protein